MGDLRLAPRMLITTPVVTSVAVMSLALGIGSNAAIFSLFHQVLLRPLPVVEPERLVNLEAPGPKPGSDSCNQAGDCVLAYTVAQRTREIGLRIALGADAAHLRNMVFGNVSVTSRHLQEQPR